MDDLNAPATKADLQSLREELHTAIRDNGLQLKNELTETMRDVQTELLKAFYSFAKSTEAKLSDAEISYHLIRQRVSAAESRITDLERRLNMPPAA